MRKAATVSLLAALISVLATWSASAAVPTKLDPTFGNNGIAMLDIGGAIHEDEPFLLVKQDDGKLVMPGKAYNNATGSFDFAVLRYNANGTLDTGFGDAGKALTDILGSHDEALALVVQPDGKLVAAGVARDPSIGAGDFALVRYNTDGSLDPSFGAGGIVTTDFFGASDQALGLVIQDDGKLVAAGGATRPGSGFDFAAARYNPDGSLDTTYGIGGRVTTDFFGSTDTIMKAALTSDGKLVAAGMAYSTVTGSYDFALARYNTDGTLDTTFATFGAPGIATTDFFGGTDIGFAILVLPDGKIVVGGLALSTVSGHYDFALARYNENGSLDTTFATYGAPGIVTADFFGNYDQIIALDLQPDGKIIAVGHAKHPRRHFEFAIARFNADGSRDFSFGYGGLWAMDFFGGPDGLHGVVVLPEEGKIVVAGDTANPFTGGDDFALVRIRAADASWIAGLASGFPDSDFSSIADKTSLLDALAQIQQDTNSNQHSSALQKLNDLRTRVDGCPSAPDATDWIVDCESQIVVRDLIDQVIAKLSGN